MSPLLLLLCLTLSLSAQTIDASRYPKLQAAIDAGTDQGVVQMPPGVYQGPVTIGKNVSLIGAGMERTFITVPPGWSQPAVKYSPVSVASFPEISGFTINLDGARAANGVELHNLGAPRVHHIRVNAGAIGLLIDSTGSGHFSDLDFQDQDAAGIRLIGDNGGENHFSDIIIVRSQPGTLQAGFELLRTSTSDLGGQYLSRVRVIQLIALGGIIVNGFRFVSTVSNAQFYVSFNQCVADAISGGDAWLLQNVSDARIVNSWGANNAPKGAGFAGMHIHNSAIVQVSASDFRSHANDVAITGNANLVSFVNNRFAGETVNVHLDQSGSKTALMFLGNRYNSTPTDDPAQLAGAAVLDPLSTGGMTVWTRDDMGMAQSLRIVNQSNGAAAPAKHVRVNHRGQLEIINNEGTTPILTIDDNGTAYANQMIVNGNDVAAQIEQLQSTVAALAQQIAQMQSTAAKSAK
jgi:hypothetical protein